MPLYEYTCKSCKSEFELLVRSSEAPHCPSCQATDVERRLSVFAAHTAAAPVRSAPAGPCGSCGDPRGPGACSIN
jgi:putative FmdB family regulatory protein